MVRSNLRDAAELWLVPGLAAVLPWKICFALYQRVARWRWLYAEYVEPAVAQARALGWVQEGAAANEWARRRRLTILVDHADLFLINTRSDRWMGRHLTVKGSWPAPDAAAILCTFHWGAGMWGLRHAGLSGLPATALAGIPTRTSLKGRPLLWWYARWRLHTVSRAIKGEVVDVAGSLRPVLDRLQRHEHILAVVDVPADEVEGSLPVRLLDRQVAVPRGLLRLAVQRQIPVVVYYTGLDLATGCRYLGIEQVNDERLPQALADGVFGVLDRLIRTEPTAWHFWGQMPRFMSVQVPQRAA